MIAATLALLLLQAGQPRGPVARTPGWTGNGPEGGSVAALAISSDGAVYSGALGGLYRSVDGDAPWTRLDYPVNSISTVTWVGCAPSNPNVIYAAQTEPGLNANHVIEMYRSDDGGATWSRILFFEDDFFTTLDVAIDPANALTLYLSIDYGSMKSTDGGNTWTSLTPVVGPIAVAPSTPSTLYGNTFVEDQPGQVVDHLQKSVDAGATWTPTGLVLDGEFLVVDPEDPNVLYATGAQFARSDDGGLSVSTETTSPGPVASLVLGRGSPRRLYARVLQGSGPVLYASADRGATWFLAGSPPGGLAGLAVATVSETEDRIYGGSSGGRGAFVSTDGGARWEARITGLDAATISAIAVFPSDGRFAYALGPGFAKTSDGGATWSSDPFAPVAASGGLAVDPNDRNVLYAADTTIGIRKSSDAGASWSEPSAIGQVVTSIAVNPLHPAIVYAADGRPLESLDGGATWQVVDEGIPNGVTQIAVDPSDPSMVYAISTAVYRSTDAGAHWSLSQEGAFVAIAPDPRHPGVVYASGGSLLWRSGDFGASWTQVADLAGVDVISLACDASGVVYGAWRSENPYDLGRASPLRSDDGGATWQSIGGWTLSLSGHPAFLHAIAVDLAGGDLYAGTERGVWRASLQTPRELSRPGPPALR